MLNYVKFAFIFKWVSDSSRKRSSIVRQKIVGSITHEHVICSKTHFDGKIFPSHAESCYFNWCNLNVSCCFQLTYWSVCRFQVHLASETINKCLFRSLCRTRITWSYGSLLQEKGTKYTLMISNAIMQCCSQWRSLLNRLLHKFLK